MSDKKGTGSGSVDSFLADVNKFARESRQGAAERWQATRTRMQQSGGVWAGLAGAMGFAGDEIDRRADAALTEGMQRAGLTPQKRSRTGIVVAASIVLLGGVGYLVLTRYRRPSPMPPPPPGLAVSSASSSSASSSVAMRAPDSPEGGSGVHRLLHRTSRSISVAWSKLAPRFGAAPSSSSSSGSSGGGGVPERARRFFSSFSLPFGSSPPSAPKPTEIVGCAYIQLPLYTRLPLASSADFPSLAAPAAAIRWAQHPVVSQHLAAIDRALLHAEDTLLIGLETDTNSYTVDELNELLGMYYNSVSALAYGKHNRDPTFSFTFLLPVRTSSNSAASSSSSSSSSVSLSQDLLRRVANLADLGAVLFVPSIAEELHPSRASFMRDVAAIRDEKQLPSVQQLVLEGVSNNSIAEEESPVVSGPGSRLHTYTDVVLGGTFDHLHVGHKILLTVASIIATHSLVIGLTVDSMLLHKKFQPQMESWTARLHSVIDFLSLIHPGLEVDLVPLHDMYGPSGDRDYLTCLVVSEETVAGGPMVNLKRKENGLRALDIIVVKLAKPAPLPGAPENPGDKISSTTLRAWDAEKPARQRAWLTAQWNTLCSSLRIPADQASSTLTLLFQRYSEPHRAYHTLDHVESLLRLVSLHRSSLVRPDEVCLAVWFHDLVYETPSSASAAGAGPGLSERVSGSNERESDDAFRAFATSCNLDAGLIDRVSAMILATIRHALPDDADSDAQFFLDFDLSILGSNDATYARYTAAIRSEYIHYPYDVYLRGRHGVLAGFLQRRNLFFTPQMRTLREAKARYNIRKEMERIQQAPEMQQHQINSAL